MFTCQFKFPAIRAMRLRPVNLQEASRQGRYGGGLPGGADAAGRAMPARGMSQRLVHGLLLPARPWPTYGQLYFSAYAKG